MVDQDSRKGLVSSDEWHWYDKSKLSFWLRYDTWPVELGLCLICDIDPEKSEELDFDELVDMVNIKPEDKPPYALYKGVCLLSEDPFYKLKPKKHPQKYDFGEAKQYLKDKADWLEKDDIKPEYTNPDYTDICERLRSRAAACMKHGECWTLFESNPWHSDQSRLEPSSFIGWAASKGIDIPWLDWAKGQGLVTTERSKLSGGKTKKETDIKKNDQINELREAAVQIAIKRRVNDGMLKKHITVKKISAWLLESGKFSTGEPFTTRWREPEGIRRLLKGKHNPLSDKRYLDAKSIRSRKFNP